MRETAFVITCEHGGNRVPQNLKKLFEGREQILETHRGYDIGALEVAKAISSELGVPLFYSTITRLVADLNRSLGSKNLFSEFTSHLNKEEKTDILERYYLPYRKKVEKDIIGLCSNKRVIHVAVHSFTPELNGVKRNADIGLLYDPKKNLEKEFCAIWRQRLDDMLAPLFRTRMNYPYKGMSDSLPLKLRKHLPSETYAGIELEINQALFDEKEKAIKLEKAITKTLVDMKTLI